MAKDEGSLASKVGRSRRDRRRIKGKCDRCRRTTASRRDASLGRNNVPPQKSASRQGCNSSATERRIPYRSFLSKYQNIELN